MPTAQPTSLPRRSTMQEISDRALTLSPTPATSVIVAQARCLLCLWQFAIFGWLWTRQQQCRSTWSCDCTKLITIASELHYKIKCWQAVRLPRLCQWSAYRPVLPSHRKRCLLTAPHMSWTVDEGYTQHRQVYNILHAVLVLLLHLMRVTSKQT